MIAADSYAKPWTIFGLGIALLGLPIIVLASRSLASDPTAAASIFMRETVILALLGILFWLIVKKEKLSLSSIGLGEHKIGSSVFWGLGGMLALVAGLAACLAVFAVAGISYGSSGGASGVSKWAVLMTVIRAGVAEEVFYRGYAIERLEALTGKKWVAVAIPLILFAAFHYRQGMPGIFLAFVLGAILTGLYLWKRNLLANIIAHFLIDFVPNILLPIISGD